MKKRYLILTALLALSLAACSQEKSKKMKSGAAKTEQTAKADGTVGSKPQGAAQKKSRSGQ